MYVFEGSCFFMNWFPVLCLEFFRLPFLAWHFHGYVEVHLSYLHLSLLMFLICSFPQPGKCTDFRVTDSFHPQEARRLAHYQLCLFQVFHLWWLQVSLMQSSVWLAGLFLTLLTSKAGVQNHPTLLHDGGKIWEMPHQRILHCVNLTACMKINFSGGCQSLSPTSRYTYGNNKYTWPWSV